MAKNKEVLYPNPKKYPNDNFYLMSKSNTSKRNLHQEGDPENNLSDSDSNLERSGESENNLCGTVIQRPARSIDFNQQLNRRSDSTSNKQLSAKKTAGDSGQKIPAEKRKNNCTSNRVLACYVFIFIFCLICLICLIWSLLSEVDLAKENSSICLEDLRGSSIKTLYTPLAETVFLKTSTFITVISNPDSFEKIIDNFMNIVKSCYYVYLETQMNVKFNCSTARRNESLYLWKINSIEDDDVKHFFYHDDDDDCIKMFLINLPASFELQEFDSKEQFCYYILLQHLQTFHVDKIKALAARVCNYVIHKIF